MAAFFRSLAGVALLAAVLAGLLVAVQLVPEWQVKRASVRSAVANPEAKTTPAEVAALQNEMRKTFIQVVAGAFALFALYLTYRRVKVAEQGHITDRYTKAIEQLGAKTAENKPNVEVRLGAIYALERIAQDSPRDHWTIMEVLTAYVRQNAPAPGWVQTNEDEKAIARGPATEIQAILTVLGRRRRSRKREHNERLDLRRSDLRGAFFWKTHIERARFSGANLEGANFYRANVEEASFVGANLKGAYFIGANLEGASFYRANVERVSFEWAHLEEVSFNNANMKEASLGGANVEGASFCRAMGLALEQIQAAWGWKQAEFDDAFLRQLKSAK